MKKLILVLLAFLAVFTYISSIEEAEASVPAISGETPMEIVH